MALTRSVKRPYREQWLQWFEQSRRYEVDREAETLRYYVWRPGGEAGWERLFYGDKSTLWFVPVVTYRGTTGSYGDVLDWVEENF